jgi:transposase
MINIPSLFALWDSLKQTFYQSKGVGIMRDIDLFQLALSLTPPWEVVSSDFDPAQKRLEIRIDFPRGSVFDCPECGQSACKAHDTVDKKWRHMNFFQHEAYLNARVPRVKCPKCGIKLVKVPWARPDSGFTLLFEALIMSLVKQMPVKAVATLIGEQDTRLWRVLNHYVYRARDEVELSEVSRVGIDETSSKRGHNYISVFVDLDKTRVIYATEGKDSETIDDFIADFKNHNGNPDAIEEVCCDMSPAFIKGVEESLPNAHLTFDKFHVMKIINDAVDEVRRHEQIHRPDLKKTRFIWLKNRENLKVNQLKRLEELDVKRLNLKTARAYHIRLTFQDLWNQQPENAEQFLKKWYFWAMHSRLEPMKQAARTVKRHWNGILRWFKSKINNGILEGLNSLIQSAKSRARGYRSIRNMVTIVYLLGGKLELGLPT